MVCSPFRTVPDHQEVFVDADTDQCVIVDIVQYQSDVADEDAGAYFFNNLASDNHAEDGAEVQAGGVLSVPERLPALAASCSPGVGNVRRWSSQPCWLL